METSNAPITGREKELIRESKGRKNPKPEKRKDSKKRGIRNVKKQFRKKKKIRIIEIRMTIFRINKITST